jgi:hypothetical protein
MWDAYSAGMRPQEDWAARCIGREVRVNVVEHDDNSSRGMFDLSIAYPDRPHVAVEVTAAADEESIKLGKLVYDGKRWIVEGIVGGWMAGLHPTASMKRNLGGPSAFLASLVSGWNWVIRSRSSTRSRFAGQPIMIRAKGPSLAGFR